MLLKLQNVSKSFGALKVINEVSFEVAEGDALGIMGPNGAGKTTLLNLISGDLSVSSGSIYLDERNLAGISAERRCMAGIGRTSQIPRPFTGMTVYENVLVAAMYGSNQSEKAAEATCVEILNQTGLLPRWNVEAAQLRLLERKRLELARAMATQPRLLLLDEIAGGLTEHEVHELLDLIRAIREQGITIIWIEHIVHALVSIVDRIVAIDFGNKLAEGTPDEVINSEAFQQIYFGVGT
ncbi:MAG: ABC transporter ATP-binding protein [Chloroflexota bacterium]